MVKLESQLQAQPFWAELARVGILLAQLGQDLGCCKLSPAVEENSFIFLSPNMMNIPG